MSFFQIHQFSILEQSLKFKACKSKKNDAMGMDVAQPIWLSGCTEKGHLQSAKNTRNASLALNFQLKITQHLQHSVQCTYLLMF